MQPALPGRRPSPGALNALLLLATLLVIGCSSKPAPAASDLVVESQHRARAIILENVEDGVRRDRALELVDQLAATEHDYLERQAVLRDRLFEFNADYDSERGSFTSLYEGHQLLRNESVEELLGSLAALEQLLERNEWNALTNSLSETQGAWSEAQ